MKNSNLYEIHKNNISHSRCSRCSKNMCALCAANSQIFCPACRGITILDEKKLKIKYQIRIILIGGVIACISYILINMTTGNYNEVSRQNLIINSVIFFALGISFTSAFYYIRNTDTLDEIQELPLLGSEITKNIFLFSSIVGIPIIYFLYLIYTYFKK